MAQTVQQLAKALDASLDKVNLNPTLFLQLKAALFSMYVPAAQLVHVSCSV